MHKIKLVYSKLSYQIIGLAYEIFNELGYGYREKYYQKAFEQLLQENKIQYSREALVRTKFHNKQFAIVFLDFIIKNKIIVELKSQERFKKSNIKQIYEYLKSNNLKLGLLINFTKDGIKSKRILNLY